MQTRVNNDPERVPDTKGERTQLAAVAPTLDQLRFLPPTPANPAPTRAPTSECVVLIGIPKSEDARMKMNEETVVESIILS
jgi:hypothetical protein